MLPVEALDVAVVVAGDEAPFLRRVFFTRQLLSV